MDGAARFRDEYSYDRFWREVTRSRRHVLSPEAQEFLRVVTATCKERLFTVGTEQTFWRAQLGCRTEEREQNGVPYDEELPYCPQRMSPRAERAKEGRANAKGISCLYVATTKETAMSEVRPWVGALVSVAELQVVRTITIVDCSKLHNRRFSVLLNRTFDARTAMLSPLTPEQVHEAVWAAIDGAFSKPVADNTDNDVADYAPTQILAELFRSEGYDGVAYKSAFGENGYNVALFDLDCAKQVNGMLYKVQSIEVKFGDTPRSEYFIKV